ncbi:sodium/potassium-transporting ATPase subunit beta-2-like [Tribolium castaneum]|nr:PREDICTED: sodium/potassium-transporting ATPase subunit beta-2-like [Tribolium castaneum]|eukprot:XP_001813251.2 PREDICTED: sodium/potassium-transporting ATPase subunit beta-2-like [Tribolium castaneum]
MQLIYLLVLISGARCCQSRWNSNKTPVLVLRPSTETNLIWFKPTDQKRQHYKTDLNNLLKRYNNTKQFENVVSCLPHQSPPHNKICNFDVNSNVMAPCLPKFGFGYDFGTPCVFLKLSNVPKWRPVPYNSSNMPSEMPNFLKDTITKLEPRGMHQNIWVSCDGDTAADKEHIGALRYLPFNGFPSQYFPYNGDKEYLDPLVALHFEQPMRGVLINVECAVWARNIPRDKENKLGILQFSLMID